MSASIYQIKHILSGKIYIGSTCNDKKRMHNHRSDLKRNTHSNKNLQEIWNTYGKNSLEFRVIFLCDKSEKHFFEQKLIDYFKQSGLLLNICPNSNSRLGAKLNEDAKKIIGERSKKRLGTLHPMYGRKRPDISKLITERLKNPEARLKLRNAVIESNKKRSGINHPMYGKKRPDVSLRNSLKVTHKEV